MLTARATGSRISLADRFRFVVPLFVLLILWSSCSKTLPNILLLTLDTTRADHLGSYGSPYDATPVLDSLAGAGVCFRAAYSPVPLTLPAHASMLTGLYPWEHGVRDNGLYRLSPDLPNVARDLTRAGYRCMAVVGAYPLIRQYGVAEGFHRFDDTIPAALNNFQYPERRADVVTNRAIALLQEWDKEKPCFLWVHYFDPHAPYVQSHPHYSPYMAEINFMDGQIGRLVSTLPGKNWSILVAGDHGEGLGDHGEETHGDYLYSSTLHVPLIGSGHGWKRGSVRLDPVSLVDIAPTLRCMAGILDRSSCKTSLFEPCDDLRPLPAETVHPLVRYGWPPLRSVQFGSWKLISGERIELYHSEKDGLEQRNVASIFPDTVTAMARVLPPVPEVGHPSELSEADRRALASLGYFPGSPDSVIPRGEILPWLEKANQYIYRNQWVEAEAQFSRVLKRDPTNLRALIGVGTSRARTGELSAADSVFRMVLNRYPSYIPALQNLAMVRFLMGDDDEAENLHGKVLELLPGDITSLQSLAICLRRQGKNEESLAVYQELMEVTPGNARVYRDAGSLLAYELGRKAEGMAFWKQALVLEPTLPQADAMRREMRRWGGGRE